MRKWKPGEIAVAGIAGWELLNWGLRLNARKELYEKALHRAQELSRPLMVIGDPDGGATRGPGYGDVCVDLTGCPLAPVGVASDIAKGIPADTDSHVIFVSCVLEYVDDHEGAWAEILRVAGSRENVFIVHVSPWTLTAYLYPGAKRRLKATSYALPSGQFK